MCKCDWGLKSAHIVKFFVKNLVTEQQFHNIAPFGNHNQKLLPTRDLPSECSGDIFARHVDMSFYAIWQNIGREIKF